MEESEYIALLLTIKDLTEKKTTEIIIALQQSFVGRKDKTRALVEEVQRWQKNGYIFFIPV